MMSGGGGEENKKVFDIKKLLNGGKGKDRLLLCPICKRPGGLEKILLHSVNDPRDLHCVDCGKTWASRYLEAFWDGYAAHVNDAQPMIKEMVRISQEWVSANRIIWALARAQKERELQIPDEIMREASGPNNYFDAEYIPEEKVTKIIAKIREPEKEPTMH